MEPFRALAGRADELPPETVQMCASTSIASSAAAPTFVGADLLGHARLDTVRACTRR